MLTLSNIRISFFFESANNINNVACSSKEVYAKIESIMKIIYIYIYIYIYWNQKNSKILLLHCVSCIKHS